jgi:hypothetical protein
MGANSEAQIVMRFVEMAKLLNVYLNHSLRPQAVAVSIRTSPPWLRPRGDHFFSRARQAHELAALDARANQEPMLCRLLFVTGRLQINTHRGA